MSKRKNKNPYYDHTEQRQQDRKPPLHQQITSAPLEQNRYLQHPVLDDGLGKGQRKEPRQNYARATTSKGGA